MIDEEVWRYATERQGYEAKFVFCHPAVLLHDPLTSLYYRGLSGMSQKIAKGHIGAIEGLELGEGGAKIDEGKARLMACTYNAFICSIVKNSIDWTLENGYRTIIATLGITLDGSMRGKIGKVAEQRLRSLLILWLKERDLIQSPTVTADDIESDRLPNQYQLANGIRMRFGSEPDVSFTTASTGRLAAVIEIKGGSDPAGALERYGASKKSFEHALSNNPVCKNFFLSAIYTDEMTHRIERDRLVEHHFNIVKILDEPAERERFFQEVFHFALRVIP